MEQGGATRFSLRLGSPQNCAIYGKLVYSLQDGGSQTDAAAAAAFVEAGGSRMEAAAAAAVLGCGGGCGLFGNAPRPAAIPEDWASGDLGDY